MDDKEFIRAVAEETGLSREESADLARATLETLARRLSATEALHLAPHLPEGLRASARPQPKQERFDLGELTRRISERTGLNLQETRSGVRAVLRTLRAVVGNEVYDHVMSQLPAEFRDAAESDARS
ncbi:MAG: hypothetical protein QOE54_6350 [Streptosporangiaceae bacterium]|jgi:uncharacterized protein (DUF2267 family)|nr:hypothetical protein [Streptosporangiaceae bacterium]MDX6433984.1 hypothetical protein [Streptosporangiaceae bacterium]